MCVSYLVCTLWFWGIFHLVSDTYVLGLPVTYTAVVCLLVRRQIHMLIRNRRCTDNLLFPLASVITRLAEIAPELPWALLDITLPAVIAPWLGAVAVGIGT